MEWSDEKPADNLLLLVYAGADASFTLYEDDGLTYGYEKGEFSTIPLAWDEESRTLTIGDREGSYPGMLESRRFRVKVVDASHPFVWNPDVAAREVVYEGKAIQITL